MSAIQAENGMLKGMPRKSKHKLLEVIECFNKQSKYYANDVETIKNAYKALYYLLSIEKNK